MTAPMARKRSRIDHLNLPFVVTVSMAAGACGGTVIGSSDGDHGPGGTGGETASGGAGATASGGRAAGGAGARNTGGWSTGGGVVGGSGAIGFGGGVNPPLPVQCPPSAPVEGTPCNLPQAMSCVYGDSPCVLSVRATCLSGLWQLGSYSLPGSCNPPAPPPSTTCPTAEPVSGSFCTYVGPSCGYGDCFGLPTKYVQCTANSWVVSFATCNPPYFPEAGVDAGGEPADGG